MVFNISNSIKNLYFIGDTHGEWNIITNHIKRYKIKDSAFIFCGDVGIGFESLNHYTLNVIPKLNKALKINNNIFLWIRGNHDNPKYFSEQLINFECVKCIPDYSIINVVGKNVLCVGGGM